MSWQGEWFRLHGYPSLSSANETLQHMLTLGMFMVAIGLDYVGKRLSRADGGIAWWEVVMSIRGQFTALQATASGLPAKDSTYVLNPLS